MRTPYGEISLQMEALIIQESGDVIVPFQPICPEDNNVDYWIECALSTIERECVAGDHYSVLVSWWFVAEDGTKGFPHFQPIKELP